jgi:hypothetical protein
VLLDDHPVSSLERGNVQRLDNLFEVMKARRKESKDHSPGSLYHLAVADEVNGAQLKSAFQTAAFSGWVLALLDLGGKSVALHAQLPQRPDVPRTSFDLPWPKETLVLVIRSDSVELWRANATLRAEPSSDSQGTPDAQAIPQEEEPAKSVGSVSAENVTSGLPFLLRTVCEQGPDCSPAVLYLADDAPVLLVRGALRALTAVPTRSARYDLQLRSSKPEALGKPLRVRVGATAVPGGLPPVLIQRTMRANFDHLRECYVAGLARDRKLTGKIILRFVIGRDGGVLQASATDGTAMPDAAVIDCVLEQLRSFRFPAPEGGIVTVVYPIVFAPSE